VNNRTLLTGGARENTTMLPLSKDQHCPLSLPFHILASNGDKITFCKFWGKEKKKRYKKETIRD
jgi:hypothetical protein